ncbi:hypothetical protein Lal_00042170, partial [Lupinus albus]
DDENWMFIIYEHSWMCKTSLIDFVNQVMSILEIRIEKMQECVKSTIILKLGHVLSLRNTLQVYSHPMPLSCSSIKIELSKKIFNN